MLNSADDLHLREAAARATQETGAGLAGMCERVSWQVAEMLRSVGYDVRIEAWAGVRDAAVTVGARPQRHCAVVVATREHRWVLDATAGQFWADDGDVVLEPVDDYHKRFVVHLGELDLLADWQRRGAPPPPI